MAKSLLDKHLNEVFLNTGSCAESIYTPQAGAVDPIVEGILARQGNHQPTQRQEEVAIPTGGEVFFEHNPTEKWYQPTSSGDARAGGLVWEQMRRLFPDLDGEPGQYCIACLSTDLTPAGNFRIVCAKCGRFVRWKNSG